MRKDRRFITTLLASLTAGTELSILVRGWFSMAEELYPGYIEEISFLLSRTG
jgi:hypothetical protein